MNPIENILNGIFGPPPKPPKTKIETLVDDAKAKREALEIASYAQKSIENTKPIESGGVTTFTVNLSDTNLASTAGRKFSIAGNKLIYRHELSAPGGRFTLTIGGQVKSFKPGDSFTGGFKEFQLNRHELSAVNGIAEFMVLPTINHDFEEADFLEAVRFNPVYLVGSSSSFIAQGENAEPPTFTQLTISSLVGTPILGETLTTGGGDPSTYILVARSGNLIDITQVSGPDQSETFSVTGVTSAATFNINPVEGSVIPLTGFYCNGWKKLRVFIDGQSSNTLTSVNLIPWILIGSIWYEHGDEVVTIPDSVVTAERYRMVEIELEQNYPPSTLMFFQIASLAPAAQTQLGFAIQGIL